jgi:DNA-binding NtrC family response regulator
MILIIDDCFNFRRDFYDPLGKIAGKIITATNYQEAIQALEKNREIDFIFLDRDLSDNKNGEDVAKFLVENELHQDSIIIIHSMDEKRFDISDMLRLTHKPFVLPYDYMIKLGVEEVWKIIKNLNFEEI